MSVASVTSARAPIESVASSKPASRQPSWTLSTGLADGGAGTTDPVDGRVGRKLTPQQVANLGRVGIESDAAAGPPPASLPGSSMHSDAESCSAPSDSADDAPQTIKSSRKTRNNARRRERKLEPKEEARIICSNEKGDDKLTCLTCGVLFQSPSPYKGIGRDHPNDNFYPWATYYWVVDAAGNKCRRPKGRNCGPCRNCFGSGGWDYVCPETQQQLAMKSAGKTKNGEKVQGFTIQMYTKEMNNPSSVYSKTHSQFLQEREQTMQANIAAAIKNAEMGGERGHHLRMTAETRDNTRAEAKPPSSKLSRSKAIQTSPTQSGSTRTNGRKARTSPQIPRGS